MFKTSRALVLLLPIFLTGCVGSPAHTRHVAPGKIEDTLDYWKGKDIESAVNRYGPPENIQEFSGKNYFAWSATGRRGTCKWWLTTDLNGVIVDSSANGPTDVCFAGMSNK